MPQFETPQLDSGSRPINATQTSTGEVLVRVPDVGNVVVREASGGQNWKTITFNIGIAVILAVLTLMTTIDWTKWIDPTLALFLVTIANALLRSISAITGGGPAGSNVIVQKLHE